MGNALKTRRRENWKIKFFHVGHFPKIEERLHRRDSFFPSLFVVFPHAAATKGKRKTKYTGKANMWCWERRGKGPPSLPVSVPFCLGKKEEAEAEREKVNKKIWERGGGKERKERGRETDNATLSINPTTHTKTATKFSFYFCRLPINSLLQIWSAQSSYFQLPITGPY